MNSVLFRALTLLACLGALTGCKRPDAGVETSSQPAVEPRLVFSDEFDRSELGEDWKTESDAWSIADGQVHVQGARNEGLWLARPLPEKVRITFDARALSEEGDIKFEVFTDGATHQSGYVGIFGGWNNRLNIIARLDEHGDDRLVGAEGQHVVPEQTYAFMIERTDGRVRWSIDGQEFITFNDREPLVGEGHQYFGFNDWDAPVRFDNLRIYDLGAAP